MGTTGAVQPRRKTGGYAALFPGRKRAHKSTAVKNVITIKDSHHDDDILIKRRRLDSSDYDKTAPVVSLESKHPSISGCVSIFDYECLHRINHGAYGTVYRARHVDTEEIVAVKKESLGLCKSTSREINILRSLRHPSIVGYKQVAVDEFNGVYVVMEYLEHDLHGYIFGDNKKRRFALEEVKRLMKELLEGVQFLHDNRVMHRDLKPSNVLVDSGGKLKICDFGMSRQFCSMWNPPCTPGVCTLWYRAPEILLGTEMHSPSMDMWSVGCIMAEVFLREVLFRGEYELQQLRIISKILEQPLDLLHNKLTDASTSKGGPELTEAGFDLLCQLLAYDPKKRITAHDALNHKWFDELN